MRLFILALVFVIKFIGGLIALFSGIALGWLIAGGDATPLQLWFFGVAGILGVLGLSVPVRIDPKEYESERTP